MEYSIRCAMQEENETVLTVSQCADRCWSCKKKTITISASGKRTYRCSANKSTQEKRHFEGVIVSDQLNLPDTVRITKYEKKAKNK